MKTLEYTYAILNVDLFEKCTKSKFANKTFRYNNDKTKVLVSFLKENQEIINSPLYNKNNIKKILTNPEWK
jgi:hypothetical protein